MHQPISAAGTNPIRLGEDDDIGFQSLETLDRAAADRAIASLLPGEPAGSECEALWEKARAGCPWGEHDDLAWWNAFASDQIVDHAPERAGNA
jgi:hypothetical protein